MLQTEIYVWIITGAVMIAYVPYLLYGLGFYKFMKISIDVFFCFFFFLLGVREFTSQCCIVRVQMRQCREGAENELIHWARLLILSCYNSSLLALASPVSTAKQLNVLRSHGQRGRALLEGEAKLISLFKCSQ